jgi:HNH endonuclease
MLQGEMRNALADACRLDNLALVAQLAVLAQREREATVALVAHIAELETRDLHLRQGYSSLFVYCREALALSEHDAYRLVAAARVARRFPVVLEMLGQGSITLTTVKLLAPCLTAENHREVLETARGKRRAQVEEIVARFVPEPDVPPMIERLLSPGATPSSADRYRVQLTVGRDTVEKLRLAQDMLRHVRPASDEATVLERALSALLADLAKKKFAAADQPRPARGTAAGSRHLPAEVKRVVWLRDLGRCAFVGTTGRRCGERGFLEFHHVQPHAAGGQPTSSNIQLRCRRHNDYEARIFFGPDVGVLASDDRE